MRTIVGYFNEKIDVNDNDANAEIVAWKFKSSEEEKKVRITIEEIEGE